MSEPRFGPVQDPCEWCDDAEGDDEAVESLTILDRKYDEGADRADPVGLGRTPRPSFLDKNITVLVKK